MKKVKLRWLE